MQAVDSLPRPRIPLRFLQATLLWRPVFLLPVLVFVFLGRWLVMPHSHRDVSMIP